MSDEVTRQSEEAQADRTVARQQYDWMMCERNDWQKRAEMAERAVAIVSAERDSARADLRQAEVNNHGLTIEVANMRAGLALATKERDAALNVLAVASVPRDAARAERDAARAERDAARAEAEGLRADLLAHPPEVHQELAIERQRHLELMEDYDRREVVITTLEDALKRTENALATAQAKHVDERLKGFLAVISQLADQAQDLLS